MDASQQRHLKISRAPGSSQEEGHSLLVQVSLDGDLIHKSSTLVEPLSSAERADLRWYLEQYASQEPFDSARAHKAATSISTYAKELQGQLKVDRIFQKSDPLVDEDYSLTIDVEEGPAEGHTSSSSLQSLHWELLEQLEVWSGFFSNVTVRRLSPQQFDSNNLAPMIPTPINGTLNVLVVIARNTEVNPTAYQDVGPFAALDVLLRIRETLEHHTRALSLRLEVVRPGTFDALKRHLKTSTDAHGTGFYHLIHLDVHGRVAKRRLASGDT